MRKKILFFFDTDERASPFDISMAYDAGFDVVVPYSSVTAESAKGLVQDAIFPRGPEGVKHTSFFLGGADVQEVSKMLEVTKESMFGPFQASIIVDPRGANTTASALVAKVEAGLAELGEGGLKDKKVAIIAGTGPVGRVAAELCANSGAKAFITSRREEKAKKIAAEISERCETEVGGLQASNDEETLEAVKDADVILSTAKLGIRTISKEVLEQLDDRVRVVGDVNAVQPTGVEGLDPNDDMKEFMENTYGIGALAAGNLKSKVELELLTQAKEADKGVFDHRNAFEIAKDKLK
ncbi:hypothetical protein AKJ45_02505 [candidate division MSBL1 archaeon SCGC-AAA261F19]|uniref:Methylene-tetrahydromethanopterin dehydrogenase N-terminal domain-containing protein n=2 Tax=candidate division MSBL1 TaxID=215777 RepID=A0A133V9N9_9EURY|nr:hypothetical protein AKJ43_00915 [candidate division MSBL1 archaeon SCGC-AAA261D19]KXB03107.1 hypothetical protein AKJ45_02505 [candidate division MSBL1 archaeon SCGC-AAA261F19]